MEKTDKRSDIMRAALELIGERGFHGAPMAEIAERAGVAAGTIYRYFASKDVLINDLHQALEDRMTAMLQEGFPHQAELRERFLFMVRALLRYFMAHPLHFRYMEQFFNSPYGVCMHRERLSGASGKRDILVDLMTEGIGQGVLKELPVIVLFALAFGPMIFLIRDHILGFVTLDEALIQRTTEACWDALKR